MANYIRGRYGTPAAAWAHERANNWYAKGGLVGYAQGGLVGGAGVRDGGDGRAARGRRT